MEEREVLMWYTIGMAAAMGIRIWVMAWTLEGVEKEMWDAKVSQAAGYQKT